ncbi:MAG: two-component regulator propeller domain-containing protein, partial [Anaerolineae bacterium]
SNKVTAIATAPDGTLQVVALPDRYDQGGGAWQYDAHAWTSVSTEDSLAGGDIPSTVTAPDGTVWAIRERGIARSDGEHWTIYTAEDGLVDNNVTAIAVAADGTIWIATKGGVSKYTPPE